MPHNLSIRFWRKVNKKGPFPDPKKYPKLKTRCWVWIGYRNKLGYGRIGTFYDSIFQPIPAHRASWFLKNGYYPREPWRVLHKCDNPSCVRPSHLCEGTAKDNSEDMVAKGRVCHGERSSLLRRGELHGKAKLCEKQVIEIRKLYASGKYSLNGLATYYSVSQGAIQAVVYRRNWKYL